MKVDSGLPSSSGAVTTSGPSSDLERALRKAGKKINENELRTLMETARTPEDRATLSVRIEAKDGAGRVTKDAQGLAEFVKSEEYRQHGPPNPELVAALNAELRQANKKDKLDQAEVDALKALAKTPADAKYLVLELNRFAELRPKRVSFTSLDHFVPAAQGNGAEATANPGPTGADLAGIDPPSTKLKKEWAKPGEPVGRDRLSALMVRANDKQADRAWLSSVVGQRMMSGYDRREQFGEEARPVAAFLASPTYVSNGAPTEELRRELTRATGSRVSTQELEALVEKAANGKASDRLWLALHVQDLAGDLDRDGVGPDGRRRERIEVSEAARTRLASWLVNPEASGTQDVASLAHQVAEGRREQVSRNA